MGIMSSQSTVRALAGQAAKRANGAIVSDREGETVAYALFDIQERRRAVLRPGVPVYEGMICGEHAHPNDLDVNVTRARKLTTSAPPPRRNIILQPAPRDVAGEALEWINEDELVEVTRRTCACGRRCLRPGTGTGSSASGTVFRRDGLI